ncbi:tRNA pseudouridine(38-40) synthase TruA [Fodinisporobacter ferrooxydans]|uniref:tRNA pseudouridine synthase A n=2 Tax=Fodinisporobacter ferrooxydans TaxID=2901836 RepID=A0ABY4CQL7_9BACL|nr:tRNA pseudouridine(38-40) synthase TruA [Alicyclobacillaceae bacterium MYW30-H2]
MQPGLRTVQGVFTDVLSNVVKHPLHVEGSGRTDAGVHAIGQVISAKVHCSIPAEKWPIALNTRLPNDLCVREAEMMPDDFHARFSAVGKTYRYTVDRGKVPDIFLHRYAFHHPRRLNLPLMYEASQYLIGTHDFTSFCGASSPVDDKVRTIYSITLIEEGQLLHLYCTGNGFLYNMVRILAGTLLQVGVGRWKPEHIVEMLRQKNRTKAGITAPAHGLSLWQVYYDRQQLDRFVSSFGM